MPQLIKERIIGIDPGLRFTGYGVIETYNRKTSLIDYGVISTNSQQPLPERLHRIYSGLDKAIQQYQPDVMALESLLYCKNVSIALLLGQARGAAIVAAAQHQLPMHEFAPTEIKSAIVGQGRASKDQVQKMIKLLLCLEEVPEPDHAADALAVALTYVHSKPTKDLLLQLRIK